MRVTLSCVSRILIFSSWMFVTYDGNFHPTATILGFYITFSIMVVFNVVLNKSKDILSLGYWIGKVHDIYGIFINIILDIILNSYSSVLQYNHIDYQAIMSQKKRNKRELHESTMIRQIIYLLVIFILYLGYDIIFHF